MDSILDAIIGLLFILRVWSYLLNNPPATYFYNLNLLHTVQMNITKC